VRSISSFFFFLPLHSSSPRYYGLKSLAILSPFLGSGLFFPCRGGFAPMSSISDYKYGRETLFFCRTTFFFDRRFVSVGGMWWAPQCTASFFPTYYFDMSEMDATPLSSLNRIPHRRLPPRVRRSPSPVCSSFYGEASPFLGASNSTLLDCCALSSLSFPRNFTDPPPPPVFVFDEAPCYQIGSLSWRYLLLSDSLFTFQSDL